MPGRTVTDTVALAAGDLTGAVQGFGHEDKVPLAGPGLVDGVFPELGGKALGKVASQSVDADMGLIFWGRGGMTRFFQPVDRIVGEVVPDLARGRGVTGELVALEQEGELVGVVRIGLVGVLRPLLFDQRIVIAEIEFAHVSPIAEVVAVRRDGDFVGVGGRRGREALLGIPAGIESTDLLPGVARDPDVDRALTHDGVRRAVVESAVHHHADAPVIEALDEGLEFGHRIGRGVAATEHRHHRPVIPDSIRTARVESRTGLRIDIASFDADRVDRLQPEHVHAERGVVVFVQRVGALVVSGRFPGQRRVVDQIKEGAAARFRGVLRLDNERVDLVHIQGEGFLWGDYDSAVPAQSVVSIVDVVAAVNACYFVANLQAVGAAEIYRQGAGVVAIRVRSRHRVGTEVGVGGARDGRRVFLQNRVVSSIEVSKDFDVGNGTGGIWFEFDGELRGVAGDFVEVEATEAIISVGLVAVHGDQHFWSSHVKLPIEILVPDRSGGNWLEFRNFDVGIRIPELGRGLGEERATEASRVGADSNEKSLGNRAKDIHEIQFSLQGLTGVPQPIPSGTLEAVLRGKARGREKPWFGGVGAIESAIDQAPFGRGPIPVDTEIVKIRLTLISVRKAFGIEFNLGGGSRGDGYITRKDATIPPRDPN